MDRSDSLNRSEIYDGSPLRTYGDYAERRSEGAVNDLASKLNTRQPLQPSSGERYIQRESGYAPAMPAPVRHDPPQQDYASQLWNMMQAFRRLIWARPKYNRPNSSTRFPGLGWGGGM